MKITAPIVATLLALAPAAAYADCTPEAPTGIKVVHTGPACQVKVSWSPLPAKPGCGAAMQYRVETVERGSASWIKNPGAATAADFSLQQKVATTFKVFAVNGGLIGPKAAPVAFTCDQAAPGAQPVAKNECTPEAPTGFTLGNVNTMCGVNLKWNPVARKPACPDPVSYTILTTENGGGTAYYGAGDRTATPYPTKKNVTTSFQVMARRGDLDGPLSARLSFKCDHDRISWAADPNNPMHRPCVDKAAPCGRYLNLCRDPRVDKNVLSANCLDTAKRQFVPQTLPLPCAGMIDHDHVAVKLVCVEQ